VLGVAALAAVLVVIAIKVMSIGGSESPSAVLELRQAETAAEAFATEHGGTYLGLGAADLYRHAPTLADGVGVEATANTFVITVAMPDGSIVRLWRRSDGSELLTCAPATATSCPAGSVAN
jgi:hypothetical protein